MMRHTWIGDKMRAVQLHVAGNPGCTKLDAARNAGTSHGSIRLGYEAVDRAIAAGLITAHRQGGRYALYPAGYSDCVPVPAGTQSGN